MQEDSHCEGEDRETDRQKKGETKRSTEDWRYMGQPSRELFAALAPISVGMEQVAEKEPQSKIETRLCGIIVHLFTGQR